MHGEHAGVDQAGGAEVVGEAGQLADLPRLAGVAVEVGEAVVVGGEEEAVAVDPALEGAGVGALLFGVGEEADGGFAGGEVDGDQLDAVAVAVDLGLEVDLAGVGGPADVGPGEAQGLGVAHELAAAAGGEVHHAQAAAEGGPGAAAREVGDLGVVGGEAEAVDVVVGGDLLEGAALELEGPQVGLLVVALVGVQPQGVAGGVVVQAPQAAFGPVDVADRDGLAQVEGDRGGAQVEHLEGVAVAGGEEEQALGLQARHPAFVGEAGEEGLEVDAAVEVADQAGADGGDGVAERRGGGRVGAGLDRRGAGREEGEGGERAGQRTHVLLS